MTFSTVILAGGRSSRMGRDKAFLEVDGRPLLARQIELVLEAGAQEVFISGRPEVNYAAFGCRLLNDRVLDAGPLGGIESALAAAPTPLVLILAVDMPHMNAELLRRLASHCSDRTGAIPRVEGNIEPLAAFYPKAAWQLVRQLLASLVVPALAGPPTQPPNADRLKPGLQMRNDRPAKSPSATMLAERCVAAGLATFVDFPADDARSFANWNSPTDLPCTT